MNSLRNILFLLSLIVMNSCVDSYNTSTLVLLQIIHRHGDRTPIDFYPNDPYKGVDKWVDGLGELTPRGKERMYSFGKQLRQRYGEYLGESPKNIYLRSSSSDRCIESAATLVAGMYPPKDRWIWSKDDVLAQFWQPISIETELKSTDGLLVPNSNCPAADEAYEEIMRSKEVTDFMSSQKEFIEEIERKTGQNYTTLRQLDYLYDTINSELSFDEPKPVPKWIQELGNDTLDRLQQFELNAFKYDWSSKKVQRLRAGLLFKELITNMKNVVNNSADNQLKKVYSYSTHDTIIVTVLQSLGLYTNIPPSYGSALLFELHRINDQYLIHLFYANVTPVLAINELDLKVCHLNQMEIKCELNQFVDSVKEFIPNDWHKECESHKKIFSNRIHRSDGGHNRSTNKDLFIGFISGILAVIILTLIISALIIISKRLKGREKRHFENSYSVNNLSHPMYTINENKNKKSNIINRM